MNRADRLAGGLWGLLIGDALGVPYEFHSPEDLPAEELIEMTPPPNFRRSHRGVPPGTWSDDGAQALCLLASLLHCGRFDLGDFSRRLLNWYDHGYMAVDNQVFDVGIQTGNALNALRRGASPREAASADERANGNGSLMRVLPLALWHRGTDAELVTDAHEQSLVTHAHPRSQVCCALYCLWGRRILDEAPQPWQSAVEALRTLYAHDEVRTHELEWSIRPDDPQPKIGGSGYVVDCLRSAKWSVEQGPYEQAVRAAILLGHDTDTTACVAGGIAGLRDGTQGVPPRWRDALRGRELFLPLLEQLTAR